MSLSYGPTPGGAQVPTSNYDSSIISMFPRVNKRYMVESSINERFDRDFLSTNSSLFNGEVTDNFIEFNIPPTDREFLDFSSLQAEVKLRVTNEDGTNLTNAANVTLVDGFMHRLFQSHSIFLNGVQTEGSNHFGLLNLIKSYTNMKQDTLSSVGSNMFYKDMNTVVPDTVGVDYFQRARGTYTVAEAISAGGSQPATPAVRVPLNPNENSIISGTRDVLHCMGPLNFDMSGCDSYLLDNVNVRIRLELANASVVLLSPDDAIYKYRIDLCKLWCKKVEPNPSAMIALNKTLSMGNSIEYMFDRPLVKTVVFPNNHNSMAIDSPFNGIVPHRVMVFIIDQESANGRYNRNPNYLQNAAITNIKLELNGNTISNMKCEFPNGIAQAYASSINA